MVSERCKQWLLTVVIFGYVAAVLAVDTLAATGSSFLIDWRVFRRQLSNGFDVFKFVAWFVIPFVCCLPWMDWSFFGTRRWKRKDILILLGLAVMGAGAVLATRVFPSLARVYRGYGQHPWHTKWVYLRWSLLWTFSWLVGWEFLHRYFLLTHVQKRWPRFGWLLVPLFEGVYHIQKPLIEAGGMVVFSLFVTRWAALRRNALLPFLAHFIIELELVAFLLVT
jgi:hypothetical protein